jgi:hypothetical protein
MVTLAGFMSFIRDNMQIPASALPDGSYSILMALAISESIVNPALKVVGPCGSNSLGYTGPSIYDLAVYNLAGDNLINFASDVPGGTFFATARQGYGLNSFVAGVVSSTSDNGTGESMTVPDSLKDLTLQNLQSLKTPWGRQYLYFAQAYGTLWGLS